jgi:transcriptional regulator with XRE-family HTH domain
VPLPPPTTSAQLGAAIRLLRVSRGVTIEALAAKAGIHWTYLSEIEHRKRNPSWDVVGALAAALGITIGDLERLAGEQSSSGS